MGLLTNAEIEKITSDYLLADNKRATDIYFTTSYLMNLLMKQKKGIFKMIPGGDKVKVHLRYDGSEAGAYSRNDALSEDDRENITAAYFGIKHYFGNATLYRTDELSAAGEYAEIELVTEKVDSAMESVRKKLSTDLFSSASDTSELITGLLSLCNETSTRDYGEINEDEVVAEDGTKPWEGKVNSTSTVLSLEALQTLRSDAKIEGSKPNLIITTETLFNKLSRMLQAQQRFVKAEEVAKAGFTGVNFEGADVVVDDYCPSGYAFALNTKHIGFGVHKQGYFSRTPWEKLSSGARGRTLKILWDGNLICNHRAAHKAHAALATS